MVTLRDNRTAFDELRLLLRILVDVRARDAATSLLGERWRAPFGIAPMGASALSAYRGDIVQARGAAAAGPAADRATPRASSVARAAAPRARRRPRTVVRRIMSLLRSRAAVARAAPEAGAE